MPALVLEELISAISDITRGICSKELKKVFGFLNWMEISDVPTGTRNNLKKN